jgi:hypothetical protein
MAVAVEMEWHVNPGSRPQTTEQDQQKLLCCAAVPAECRQQWQHEWQSVSDMRWPCMQQRPRGTRSFRAGRAARGRGTRRQRGGVAAHSHGRNGRPPTGPLCWQGTSATYTACCRGVPYQEPAGAGWLTRRPSSSCGHKKPVRLSWQHQRRARPAGSALLQLHRCRGIGNPPT